MQGPSARQAGAAGGTWVRGYSACHSHPYTHACTPPHAAPAPSSPSSSPSLLHLVLGLHSIHSRSKLVAPRRRAAQRLRHSQPQLVCTAAGREGRSRQAGRQGGAGRQVGGAGGPGSISHAAHAAPILEAASTARPRPCHASSPASCSSAACPRKRPWLRASPCASALQRRSSTHIKPGSHAAPPRAPEWAASPEHAAPVARHLHHA